MTLSWCSEVYSRHASLVKRTVGLLLAGAGLAGAVYSLHVASAQSAYRRLKYGNPVVAEPALRSALAAQADRRYRHNYYLSLLLAEEHWSGRGAGGGPRDPEDTRAAAYWCRRGIEQNPYRRELRWMEALLAGLTSPSRARSLWNDYVDFAFWDAWNLASLAVLTAEAGLIEDAMELLPLLRDSPQYARARNAIEAAWRKESQGTPRGISR